MARRKKEARRADGYWTSIAVDRLSVTMPCSLSEFEYGPLLRHALMLRSLVEAVAVENRTDVASVMSVLNGYLGFLIVPAK